VSASPAPHEARAVSLVSGIHRLDARLHEPAGERVGGLVVAHPHPAHGGDMDHPVVVTTAERAAARGLLALRFDFRGVRRSEGDETDRPGHLDDWRTALKDLRRRVPAGPLLAGGFSYGARALAEVVRTDGPPPGLAGLLLLAPATRVPQTRRDFGHLLLGRPLNEARVDAEALRNLRGLPVPAEVLVGDGDVVAPHEELRANLASAGRLTVLPGLSHFFSRGRGAGRLAEDLFVPALDAALDRLLPA
jgi:alpha/beta superfamily hydrolase